MKSFVDIPDNFEPWNCYDVCFIIRKLEKMRATLYYSNKEQIEDIAIYAVSKKFHDDFLDYNCKISDTVNDTIDLIIKDFENRHFDLLSNPYYIILDDANID